jgi:FtsH-binding integral membrane protein
MTNYDSNFALKHLLYGGFLGGMAMSMIPLISMCSMPIIYDALFATGITMSGLGLVAYNSPNEKFLQYGGMMGIALAGLIGVSLLNIFFRSPFLMNA